MIGKSLQDKDLGIEYIMFSTTEIVLDATSYLYRTCVLCSLVTAIFANWGEGVRSFVNMEKKALSTATIHVLFIVESTILRGV